MDPAANLPAARSELDAEELTFLAVKAMREDRDDDALGLLRRAIQRDPQSGKPHHLIGAILASQQKPARAIEAMTEALALEPQLAGARWQLGLLHFTSGNVVGAQAVWQAFDGLEQDHPYRLFKTGMLHLARDEFDDCVAMLERGTALCDTASVNKDMQSVIDKVRAVVKPRQSASAAASASQSLAQYETQHVMLARYKKPSPDDEKGP